eukprot:395041_1
MYLIYFSFLSIVYCSTRKIVPQNLIIMIGDGLGNNYNTAYRIYNNLTSTILDNYFIGKYSTSGIYPYTSQIVIDSAAGAEALASGYLPTNNELGLNKFDNPISNILEAGKLSGKGIGIISTTRVTHATPAAFSAHVFHRDLENLVAKQQGMSNSNGYPFGIDILFGGGKRHFEAQYSSGSRRKDNWDFISNYSNYGWNSLIYNSTELELLTINDLPSIGLFTSSHFPFYMDRNELKNDYNSIPNLLNMTQKAIELLSSKYNNEGYILMIEGSRIDHCGHRNDIACLLHEMDEYYMTMNYVINNEFVNLNNTLITFLADHETGGLSLGRSTDLYVPSLRKYMDSMAPYNNKDLSKQYAQTDEQFIFDPLIPNLDNNLYNIVAQSNMYQWYYKPIKYAKLSANYINSYIISNNLNIQQTIQFIQNNFIKNLTNSEKLFIYQCYNISNGMGINRISENLPDQSYDPFTQCLTKLMNTRTLTGFTTHGHTANDIPLSAVGVAADTLFGFMQNTDVGNMLFQIMDLEDERIAVNNYLSQQFELGILKVCDPLYSFSYVDLNVSLCPWRDTGNPTTAPSDATYSPTVAPITSNPTTLTSTETDGDVNRIDRICLNKCTLFVLYLYYIYMYN